MGQNTEQKQPIFPVSENTLLNSRLSHELRVGRPIVLKHGSKHLIYGAAETLDQGMMDWLKNIGQSPSFILLSHHRAETLHIPSKGAEVVCLITPEDWQAEDIHHLAEPQLDMDYPMRGPFQRLEAAETPMAEAALILSKRARLLPAGFGVIAKDPSAIKGLLLFNLDTDSIENPQNYPLSRVAQAHVPLEHAEDTLVTMFRPQDGGIEHMALIIGSPDLSQPVLMRLHSECFTGDLMGSLKCDCGDQLKGAIKAIAEAGGGVLLYLAQEGRGIGLPAKLKAYALQDQGFDTVDANTRLGFDVDERLFFPAIEMLRHLHIKAVRLLTNNPNKVTALKEAGINVVERVEHKFPSNQHNDHYLTTKKLRTGHLF